MIKFDGDAITIDLLTGTALLKSDILLPSRSTIATASVSNCIDSMYTRINGDDVFRLQKILSKNAFPLLIL